MHILLTVIVTWLSTNFGLPASYSHPQIVFVAPETMQVTRYQAAAVGRTGQPPGSAQPASTSEIESFYDDSTRTIYLRDEWSEESLADLSVLVHEMVHHLQNIGDLDYSCPEAREKPAYTAQDQWLKQFGRNLIDEFTLDAMTVLVRTRCLY